MYKGSVWQWLGRVCRLILVVAILTATIGVSYYWLTNQPTTQRRPAETQATLVETIRVGRGPEQIIVRTMGTVIPARKTQLASRVSGQIVEVSPQFAPGGRFAAEEEILQVDPRDYELAVLQRQGDMTGAQAELRLEMGQQSVAQREYELLGQELQNGDEDLLLRQPQLDATEAAISIAQASLEKARLDLQRTVVRSPYNAIVQSRNVDLGSYVAPGASLATLVGTDEYWVEVSIPVDELRWIAVPGLNGTEGAVARVYDESAWGAGAFREGRVERLMTELEPEGFLARLLVTVEDPLQLSAPAEAARPLILGSFVRVEIDGEEIPSVVKAPRTALREGAYVWVMAPDETLEIRRAHVVWGTSDHVFLTEGLEDGDLLVLTDLATPVPGMALRTAEESPASSPEEAVDEPATVQPGKTS